MSETSTRLHKQPKSGCSFQIRPTGKSSVTVWKQRMAEKKLSEQDLVQALQRKCFSTENAQAWACCLLAESLSLESQLTAEAHWEQLSNPHGRRQGDFRSFIRFVPCLNSFFRLFCFWQSSIDVCRIWFVVSCLRLLFLVGQLGEENQKIKLKMEYVSSWPWSLEGIFPHIVPVTTWTLLVCSFEEARKKNQWTSRCWGRSDLDSRSISSGVSCISLFLLLWNRPRVPLFADSFLFPFSSIFCQRHPFPFQLVPCFLWSVLCLFAFLGSDSLFPDFWPVGRSFFMLWCHRPHCSSLPSFLRFALTPPIDFPLCSSSLLSPDTDRSSPQNTQALAPFFNLMVLSLLPWPPLLLSFSCISCETIVDHIYRSKRELN